MAIGNGRMALGNEWHVALCSWLMVAFERWMLDRSRISLSTRLLSSRAHFVYF
jgi:hypothetical protein